MVFSICVAADTFGQKHNLRLEFASCPIMTTLVNAIESQYEIIARSCQPTPTHDNNNNSNNNKTCQGLVPPFRIDAIQIYDEDLLRWVDMYSTAQLRHNAQLYVFQPQGVWNVDVPGTIPAAKAVISWVCRNSTDYPSVRIGAHSPPSSASPMEKGLVLFRLMDRGAKGFLRYGDFKAVMAECGMELVSMSLGELYDRADRTRSGEVSYEDFVRWSLDHSELVDALYHRTFMTNPQQQPQQQHGQRGDSRALLGGSMPSLCPAEFRTPNASCSMPSSAGRYLASPAPALGGGGGHDFASLRAEHALAQRQSREASERAQLAHQREKELEEELLRMTRRIM
eukprot:PhM_4_TR14329/c0_g1_i1/m.49960